MTPETQAVVDAMLEQDGIYIGGNSADPSQAIPLHVRGGKAYSMRVDEHLARDRFNDTFTVVGPYWAKPVGSKIGEVTPVDQAMRIAARDLPAGYSILLEADRDGLHMMLQFEQAGHIICAFMPAGLTLQQQVRAALAMALENPERLDLSRYDVVPRTNPLT